MTAARISKRMKPKVCSGVVGRAAKAAANRARPTPAASVSMCPASASSAREPEISPPMTSAPIMLTVIERTPSSRLRWVPVAVPCECPWVCPAPISDLSHFRCGCRPARSRSPRILARNHTPARFLNPR